MHTRWLTPLELALLGAIWGGSFLLMRLSADAFGPLALAEVRLASGALVLLPFLWHVRAQFPWNLWVKLAGIGVFNCVLPSLLFAWAAQRAPAGVAAIANAMTVLFTSVIAALFFGDRISRRGSLALLIGFIGVVVLASGKMDGARFGWATAACTCAALCYGIALNLLRRHFMGLPTTAAAAVTLGSSALLLLPFALWQWPSADIAAQTWGAALTLGCVCTGAAFMLYYRLIARIGASYASTVTYLIPIFAVAWGWWLLDEPLTWVMLLSAGLILGSLAMSQRHA